MPPVPIAVVLAYLTVCRWCGAEVFRRVAVWPLAIAHTATFCLVEWSLFNPFTVQDSELYAADPNPSTVLLLSASKLHGQRRIMTMATREASA